MKLHTIKPAKGAVQSRKRIARGQGPGDGERHGDLLVDGQCVGAGQQVLVG